MEILKFIFDGLGHFLGILILMVVTCILIHRICLGIAEIVKAFRQP